MSVKQPLFSKLTINLYNQLFLVLGVPSRYALAKKMKISQETARKYSCGEGSMQLSILERVLKENDLEIEVKIIKKKPKE